MIREVIRPQETSFTINIPESYLDRDVEFIIFPLDEKEEIQENKKNNISSLCGSLNKYADSSKIALEDKAWETHVMEKYK